MDLAGSERVSRTNVDGQILREAKHINLSLHYLEQVILALQVAFLICYCVACLLLVCALALAILADLLSESPWLDLFILQCA